MSEPCNINAKDCPLAPRVEKLEELEKQHKDTITRIFGRLDDINRETGEQDAILKSINDKMERIINWQERHQERLYRVDSIPGLERRVSNLEEKPGKRWEGMTDKAIWAVIAAVIAFLLGRIGI